VEALRVRGVLLPQAQALHGFSGKWMVEDWMQCRRSVFAGGGRTQVRDVETGAMAFMVPLHWVIALQVIAEWQFRSRLSYLRLPWRGYLWQRVACLLVVQPGKARQGDTTPENEHCRQRSFNKVKTVKWPCSRHCPASNEKVGVGNRGVGNLRFIGLVGLGPASRVFTFHLLLRTRR